MINFTRLSWFMTLTYGKTFDKSNITILLSIPNVIGFPAHQINSMKLYLTNKVQYVEYDASQFYK